MVLESLDGIQYETVIFVYKGSLRETIIPLGSDPDPESSFEITRIDKLELKEYKDGIDFRLVLFNESGESSIEGFISIL